MADPQPKLTAHGRAALTAATKQNGEVPYGYCHCGCGRKTRLASQTDRRRGDIKGEPRQFLRGHAKRGDTDISSAEFAKRFWAKVDVGSAGSCWPWKGSTQRGGYGVAVLMVDGQRKYKKAHRIAYTLTVGPIPQGLVLDHLCETRNCCNPGHLEPVLNGVNNIRGGSPWALNAKKTHCDNGHPFAGDNLRVRPDGARACRACSRENTRRYRERLAEAA